jgi:hypothetical protein
MALPPERISVKRRRQEEPVETLCKVATDPTRLVQAADAPQILSMELVPRRSEE